MLGPFNIHLRLRFVCVRVCVCARVCVCVCVRAHTHTHARACTSVPRHMCARVCVPVSRNVATPWWHRIKSAPFTASWPLFAQKKCMLCGVRKSYYIKEAAELYHGALYTKKKASIFLSLCLVNKVFNSIFNSVDPFYQYNVKMVNICVTAGFECWSFEAGELKRLILIIICNNKLVV